MKLGTPKTLKEAVSNGLRDWGGNQRCVDEASLHVRDFLAQKFGAAMLSSDEKTEAILKQLFDEIMK